MDSCCQCILVIFHNLCRAMQTCKPVWELAIKIKVILCENQNIALRSHRHVDTGESQRYGFGDAFGNTK